ncbi:GGDEF domain-containing protein [Arcobacter sp. YIC-310]|uniref:GGDEF domain-containing protein n=1 Tax=Arcobacter sp. YIC-310 TaxID=3376632 RepID=UPI003C1637D0
MYKISVSKSLFEDILLKKTSLLTKESSKYWKKELLEPKIIDDKITYSIKQFDKLTITNGLGDDKPQLVVECKKIDYSSSFDRFEFTLGKVIEQKNTQIEEDYKDTLIEQLLKEKELLEDKMNRDHLTQVYNRKKMQEDLDKFVNQNNSNLLCAIFIDADRFKGINDNFGHDTGDRVLQYLANKLQIHASYLNGEVYRYGGEEFVILCFLPKEQIVKKVEDLRVDVKSQRVYHKNKDISLTLSMGVAFYDDFKDKDLLLQKADEAVYKAKNRGRDTIVFI